MNNSKKIGLFLKDMGKSLAVMEDNKPKIVVCPPSLEDFGLELEIMKSRLSHKDMAFPMLMIEHPKSYIETEAGLNLELVKSMLELGMEKKKEEKRKGGKKSFSPPKFNKKGKFKGW